MNIGIEDQQNDRIYYLKLLLFITIIVTLTCCKSKTINCDAPSEYDKITNRCVYLYGLLDKDPVFAGTETNIMEYIQKKHKEAPDHAYIFSLRVIFVVDKKGKVIGARIANKESNEYTNNERQIVAIVNSSPKWIPGVYSGKVVNTFVRMRFKFGINENGEIERI